MKTINLLVIIILLVGAFGFKQDDKKEISDDSGRSNNTRPFD